MTNDPKQVGGDHYLNLEIQPWDAMAAWFTAEQYEGFLVGNAIKYLARYRKKGGVQDLRKAEHFLQRAIALVEKPQAEFPPIDPEV